MTALTTTKAICLDSANRQTVVARATTKIIAKKHR
jgi:hypothetical protein